MRIVRASLLALIALVLAGCGIGSDPSAPYFEQGAPQSQQALSTPSAAALDAHILVGLVSEPNKTLTPGVIESSVIGDVCGSPKHDKASLSIAQAQAEDARYSIPTNLDTRYHFDYLVPLNLGGSPEITNLWPVTVKGIGFYQKEQLNAVLRQKVCAGELDLGTVQQQLIKNWYTLWLKYGGS
jgi:hypothetical protein